MLRCRPAKTDRIPLRSDFPAGTSFPRRDYPSAGGIPGAAAFAGTSPDRGKRIRKTTKRNGRNGKPRRGAGPRSTAAPGAKETRRRSSRASETSAHASATRRYGKTIKKKGRERPDIPFLSASRAFIRKVSLRPSPLYGRMRPSPATISAISYLNFLPDIKRITV